MGGTNWKPVLLSIEKLNNILEEYKNSRFSNTDAIINLMCKMMKMQAFNDGNKKKGL